MEKVDILRELFDEKVISILRLFMSFPEKQFYLSEISEKTKVNIATAFRILNKLNMLNYIKSLEIGKTKLYQLDKSDKTRTISNMMRGERKEPLEDFIERIKLLPRIKKIFLDFKSENRAKLLIVGEFLLRERIERICSEIKQRYNFIIEFSEVSEKQLENLSAFLINDFDKKLLWEKKEGALNRFS